jgi:hypothetical protein
MSERLLVWFSCGAASAVAAKLISEMALDMPVEYLYCDTLKYEHPDNIRFLRDVERWIGHEIKLLNPADYNGGYTDIFDVFDRRHFLNGQHGALCTVLLKKTVREKYSTPDDIHVLGYVAEEIDRAARFINANIGVNTRFVLIEKKITKRRCLFMLQEAGIELPTMYKLGYKNNNCIGCVKGGMGYWNKIKVDFPDVFDRMAKEERKLNASCINGTFLDELDTDKGNYKGEEHLECGLFCNYEAIR